MELATIKSEINKALSQSHAHGFSYNDLFIPYADQDPDLKSRVSNDSLPKFEWDLDVHLRKGKDFVIYIQCDDANYLGADCSYELDMVELNTYRFTDGNITIYVVID